MYATSWLQPTDVCIYIHGELQCCATEQQVRDYKNNPTLFPGSEHYTALTVRMKVGSTLAHDQKWTTWTAFLPLTRVCVFIDDDRPAYREEHLKHSHTCYWINRNGTVPVAIWRPQADVGSDKWSLTWGLVNASRWSIESHHFVNCRFSKKRISERLSLKISSLALNLSPFIICRFHGEPISTSTVHLFQQPLNNCEKYIYLNCPVTRHVADT